MIEESKKEPQFLQEEKNEMERTFEHKYIIYFFSYDFDQISIEHVEKKNVCNM